MNELVLAFNELPTFASLLFSLSLLVIVFSCIMLVRNQLVHSTRIDWIRKGHDILPEREGMMYNFKCWTKNQFCEYYKLKGSNE